METTQKEMSREEYKEENVMVEEDQRVNKFWEVFFSLPLFIKLPILFVLPALFLMNPMSLIFITLLIPIMVIGMKNKVFRDILLLIPLCFYYGNWAFVFLGFGLAGQFFGGKMKKLFDLGIYSIVFSFVAIYFAFSANSSIEYTLTEYNWVKATYESDTIMFWSLAIYTVIYVIVGMVLRTSSKQEITYEKTEYKETKTQNTPKAEKREKIDPNKASFKEKNALRVEQWIRTDKSDS